MDSLNRMAVELVDEALDFAEELRISVTELPSGATVLDFGRDAVGGIEAGLLLAEIQTAGLATVQTRMGHLADNPLPYVELQCDHPAISLLGSQKAGWELRFDDEFSFEGLGGGPARALVAEEDEFHEMEYFDEFDLTVLTIETIDQPSTQLVSYIAEQTDVPESGVYLPIYPTGSIAGSVSGAARAAELAVFRLFELGYPLENILSVSGSAPVAPVSYDERIAMGRTNDALAYGGEVYLSVAEDDPAFAEIPSRAREKYGTPFEEIFAAVDWNFYDVDEAVFAPASVTIDIIDGPTHQFGSTEPDVLIDSFEFDQ